MSRDLREGLEGGSQMKSWCSGIPGGRNGLRCGLKGESLLDMLRGTKEGLCGSATEIEAGIGTK